MKEIRIYLSARIRKDAHNRNEEICKALCSPIRVFVPHRIENSDVKHEYLSLGIYKICVDEMEKSHMGLLLPPYGRDCSWEVGWYAKSRKPLVVFVNDQVRWLRDWMVKGGMDYIITINPKIYQKLIKDPILKYKKIVMIKKISDLKKELIKIYEKHYGNGRSKYEK